MIFVEEISMWKNGIIPLLHKKILENGSERAKEILIEKRKQREVREQSNTEKEQESIKREYSTADVISGIAALRSKVNKISVADKRFGFAILASSEEIYQQNKPAQSKEAFVGYCMVLRSLIQNFSDEIKERVISEEEMKKLLPRTENPEGSINKFHFLLLEKGLAITDSIFGLRNINRIVSKLAHPDGGLSSELIELLTEEGLLDWYKKDAWSILHREILLKYKNVLEKLISALLEGGMGT